MDMEYIKENNRIYCLNEDNKIIAEITYFDSNDGYYTIDHTFVDESLRGQGVAKQLVEYAIEEIRKKGFKIKATCSFAKKYLEENNIC